MQENALHGWRIADKKDMRMTGYPSKTRSFSWSPDGKWLATSGADACVIWPFESKDGPMGKAPRECGVRPARINRVAFHPKAPIVALGYDDGWVLLCRITDSAELLVRKGLEETDEVEARNRPRAPVTALAWDADGKRLLFGLETGDEGRSTKAHRGVSWRGRRTQAAGRTPIRRRNAWVGRERVFGSDEAACAGPAIVRGCGDHRGRSDEDGADACLPCGERMVIGK
ncbi:MAG: PD40 domain-containing protein, partial [Rhodospirillales bacterium]|nr:PD40 domain-containing protein [Rhodospirillales bacterium]